jgi:hypothetical protein
VTRFREFTRNSALLFCGTALKEGAERPVFGKHPEPSRLRSLVVFGLNDDVLEQLLIAHEKYDSHLILPR